VNAPPRLLDDPEVGEALKRDLRCAIEHQLEFDVAASVARFEAALAGGSAAGGATQGALLKWLVVGAAGAGIGAALYLSSQGSAPEQAPAPPAKSEVRTSERAVPAEPSEAPAQPEMIRADELAVEEPPEAPIKMAGKPAPTPPGDASKDLESANDLLAREVAHLKSVRQALAGDPARALGLANAGHAEFKAGVLYQEREALALQALNSLGRRAELEERGQHYLKAFPSGSFSDQVRTMLKR
jgi:hypothetical protein